MCAVAAARVRVELTFRQTEIPGHHTYAILRCTQHGVLFELFAVAIPDLLGCRLAFDLRRHRYHIGLRYRIANRGVRQTGARSHHPDGFVFPARATRIVPFS